MERRSRSTNRRADQSSSRHASLGRLPTDPTDAKLNGYHHSLLNRPGGDSRTLSPDRRNSTSFPKTSPHHNKAGSYNQYTHPPLTLPTSIALGVNGTKQPAPPPRAPVQSSALTEAKKPSSSPPASLQHTSNPQQQVGGFIELAEKRYNNGNFSEKKLRKHFRHKSSPKETIESKRNRISFMLYNTC